MFVSLNVVGIESQESLGRRGRQETETQTQTQTVDMMRYQGSKAQP